MKIQIPFLAILIIFSLTIGSKSYAQSNTFKIEMNIHLSDVLSLSAETPIRNSKYLDKLNDSRERKPISFYGNVVLTSTKNFNLTVQRPEIIKIKNKNDFNKRIILIDKSVSFNSLQPDERTQIIFHNSDIGNKKEFEFLYEIANDNFNNPFDNNNTYITFTATSI